MPLDIAVPYTRTPIYTSFNWPCPECVCRRNAHESAYGCWHVPSFSRTAYYHEVQLNLGGLEYPECSCEHGREKSARKPLRCRHYQVARSMHQKLYGELVPHDPREPRVVRVVESNGVELFGNDEPQQQKAPARDRLVALFDQVA